MRTWNNRDTGRGGQDGWVSSHLDSSRKTSGLASSVGFQYSPMSVTMTKDRKKCVEMSYYDPA